MSNGSYLNPHFERLNFMNNTYVETSCLEQRDVDTIAWAVHTLENYEAILTDAAKLREELYDRIEELERERRSVFVTGWGAGYSAACVGSEGLSSEKERDFQRWLEKRAQEQ